MGLSGAITDSLTPTITGTSIVDHVASGIAGVGPSWTAATSLGGEVPGEQS